MSISDQLHRVSDSDYRWPAEWEPHEATWISWPHNRSDWPGKFEAIPWVYGDIVTKLTPGEKVRVLVQSEAHQLLARDVLTRCGADFSRIEFWTIETDRSWIRDYGTFFLVPDPEGSSDQLHVIDFQFSGWAQYPDWQRDNQVTSQIARQLNAPVVRPLHQDRPVVLEGGAVDTNGQGTLIATEACLLNTTHQVRNPGTGRREMETLLKTYLDIDQVLWLPHALEGDDTNGHIDDLCRFVDTHTVVACRGHDPDDSNYGKLEENWDQLQDRRLENGKKLHVIALPCPNSIVFENTCLPASYANFYIGNTVVLVPTFNDPMDRVALETVAALFPGRSTVGIHALDLLWGLGTLHCMTHQQPAI